ncbi:hypothetical protein V6Z11_D04G064900 [Gossypium hirsutum]
MTQNLNYHSFLPSTITLTTSTGHSHFDITYIILIYLIIIITILKNQQITTVIYLSANQVSPSNQEHNPHFCSKRDSLRLSTQPSPYHLLHEINKVHKNLIDQ